MRHLYKKFDMLTYGPIKLYTRFLRLLPMRACLFVGRCLGRLLYRIDKRHRNIAMANLRFAFGDEKDEKELDAITHGHFLQYGMMGHEWLRLIDIKENGLKKIRDNITVEGQEHLDAARKKSRAVILISAHFGNFEYAHLYYAAHFNRLNFIVRKLDNAYLERDRIGSNTKANVNILYRENGLRPAIKNLKKGEDLVIFPDRKASLKEGIPCQFFGKKTSTISVACSLARKYNLPMVPMFITRCKDPLHHKIVFYPMFMADDPDEMTAVQKATQTQNDIIEKAIRRYPDQWLWIHQKWKCYHSHIYE